MQVLPDLLLSHIPSRSAQLLMRALPTHESDPVVSLTYGELHSRAQRLATRLLGCAQPGDRVLLVNAGAVDFVSSLFACWYAGMVAVPVYPPSVARRAADLQRMRTVIADCDAAVLLTNAHNRKALGAALHDSTAAVIELDAPNSSDPAPRPLPAVKPQDPALIQYTSGSTGDAKGVVLTHANILANLRLFDTFGQLGEGDHVVNWMPLFHDLGLSLFLCAPYAGIGVTLLTPEGFLRRPARWLEAISHYGGVLSGAPNFAFDLCCARITDAERQSLDLTRWRVAMNAAEPVKDATLERFAQAFGPHGFSQNTMMPCYGLAEATAYGTAGRGDTLHRCHLDAQALRQNRVALVPHPGPNTHTLLGCGSAHLDSQVVIVHPEGLHALDDATIGEIWLSGPQIGTGYWGRPKTSKATFNATLAARPETYLRTGDLGFLHNGQLFVTGRLKDMIIVRGQNHYPQDIESSVEACHKAIRQGCCAAFSVQQDHGDERLVVVAETRDTAAEVMADVARAVRTAVASRHGLELYALVLLPKRHIHKTSSGKIKRRACRQSYLQGDFEAVHTQHWDPSKLPIPHTYTNALSRLQTMLAVRLNQTPQRLDLDAPFVEMGIDSVMLIDLLAQMEDEFDQRFDVSVFFEHPTLRALGAHLEGAPDTPMRPATAGSKGQRTAIVGAACRLPGRIESLEDLWTFLRSGQSAVGPVPKGRWEDASLRATGEERGGFLTDIDAFDADFFGVSAAEAAAMDPQQRLLLEVAWEVVESAGWTLESLREGRTGVFVGISASDYVDRSLNSGDIDRIGAFAGTANATSVAAGRISYVLGLRGPTVAIDTACSSSLVALHMAQQSIQAGDCDAAIVAGVNLVLSPAGHVYLNKVGALASDGHCKTFDARADGYIRAEGCVALALRPEEDARQANDRILGVLLGSAINHDGRTNGLTAPSLDAQRDCYQQALRRAGIQGHQVDYLEAHGTGTKLGDPVEVRGITEVYAPGRSADKPLHLGAVKSQLGHGEAAAGLTGVLKVLASFSKCEMLGLPGLQALNPLIDWHDAIKVTPQPAPWSPEQRRLAAVSSFGISGTNAHVILEGPAPQPSTAQTSSRGWVLPISARSVPALMERAQAYAQTLQNPALSVDDIVHTAACRRSHMNYRAAVEAESREGLVQKLLQLDPERVAEARRPRTVFVFSGHGSQWKGMGRSLMDFEVCRDVIERCEAAFVPHVDWSLSQALTSLDEDEGWGTVDRAQPMIFAMEIALAQLWRSWGVEADVVVGHSMGEIAAFYHAGALSLEDAARIICSRSRLMRQIEGQGEMLVLGVPRDVAEVWIEPWADQLAIGVHNSPDAVVLSGSAAAIGHMVERAQARNLFARRVKIDVASHSPQTEVLRKDLLQALASVSPRPSRIPVFSTVLGQWVKDTSKCVASYWFKNLRDSVRFMPAITQIAGEERSLFVEVSPHPILTTAVKRILDHGKLPGRCISSMRRGQPAHEVLHDALTVLFVEGLDIDWSKLATHGQPIDMPGYPFQRQRHWLPRAAARPVAARRHARHPFLGEHRRSSLVPGHHMWSVAIDLKAHPWLAGHKVQGAVILPATCSLELALASGQEVFGQRPEELSQIELLAPLLLGGAAERTLQFEMVEQGEHQARFEFSSRAVSAASWTVHARGVVSRHSSARRDRPRLLQISAQERISGEACYTHLEHFGLRYGGGFRGIESAEVESSKALATVRTDGAEARRGWALDPVALDACFHALGLAKLAQAPQLGVLVPKSIGRVVVFEALEGQLMVEAQAHDDDGDVWVRDAHGRMLVRIERLLGHPLASGARHDNAPRPPWDQTVGEAPAMQVVWRAHPLEEPETTDFGQWVCVGQRPAALSTWNGASVDWNQPGWEDQLVECVRSGVRHVLFVPASGSEDPVDGCAHNVLALSAVVRAMTGPEMSEQPRLWVMTHRAVQLPGVDVQAPELVQAAIWGACNAVAQEHPALRCVRLDVDSGVSPAVLASCLRAGQDQGRLALRGAASFVPRLMQAPVLALQSRFPVEEGGTHLVTGGFGALGAQLVEGLVEAGAQRVIIVSRGGASTAQRADWLAQVGGAGCEVVCVDVDVSDGSALGQAVGPLLAQGPALRGVFHAAGVLEDQMLVNLTPASLESVLAGKARGALNLDRLCKGRQTLQHFVMFSSAASVLGSPGQSAYAAANAVLDALALQRQARALPGASIPLGPVEGGGLAARDQNAARLLSRGVGTIALETVVPIVGAWLRRGDSGCIPLELNIERLRQFYPTMAASSFFEALDEQRPGAGRDEAFLGRLHQMPRSLQARSLERFLQEQVAGLLDIEVDTVSRTRSVQELGFDSLLTLELRNQLELVLGADVPVSFIWRYPSLEQLAVPLLDELGLRPRESTPEARTHSDDQEGHSPGWGQWAELETDEGPLDPALMALNEDELLALLSDELDGM